MACGHGAGFKVYRRGPGPSYLFLPAGRACPKCGRYFPPENPVGNLPGYVATTQRLQGYGFDH